MKYVLYHSNCPDGFMAAYCCWEQFGNSAQYIPCSYQNPVPDIEDNSEIYIVDFSFSRNELINLANKNKVVVLDHHKSAQENLKDLSHPNLTLKFDMTKCGAVLTWEYFHPDVPAPILYKYVQDRDLWQWQLPESRAVSAWLYLQPKDFIHFFNNVADIDLDYVITIGKIVLETQKQLIDQVIRNSFIAKIGGYYVPVVNSSVLQSEIGEALCEKYPEHPFSGIFNYPKREKSINWSLRSKGDFDVSEVAKKYGGGGHRNAAGMTINSFPI